MSSPQTLMLLLVACGALMVPLVSERLGVFAAPCEILYGTLVAVLFPMASRPDSFVQQLGQFGFLLLLFLAGMEVDFSMLRRRGAAMLGRAALVALGLQLVCVAIGVLLSWPPITILMLSAVSVSVLLVVLREQGLGGSAFGQTLLIVAALGEFFSIVELTAYDLVGNVGVGWLLVLAAFKLGVLLALGYAALHGLSRAIAQRPQRFARLVASGDPSEVGVRAALALMVAFAALAVVLNIEALLGAFIAGAICAAALGGRTVLSTKLATMGQGFFVPIFFITVGLQLRLGDLLHGLAFSELLGLLLGLVLVRLCAMPLLRLAGLPWRATLPSILLLSAPLTLQVAIAQIGLDLGQIDRQLYSAVLGMAIVSAFVFPLLARPFIPAAEAAMRASKPAIVSNRKGTRRVPVPARPVLHQLRTRPLGRRRIAPDGDTTS